jgi:hypothetical protein
MSSANAYGISAPVEFNGTGAVQFYQTGANLFNYQQTFNFVTGATGAVYYVGAASQVQGLGIGTAGQVLRVNSGATGPEWYTLASAGPLFAAYASAAGATFAGADAWTTVDNTIVTWDTTAPGVSDINFDDATGVYTVPLGGDGVYELACGTAFTGNNSGTNNLLTTPPTGRSSRQIRLLLNGTDALAVNARQADPSNLNQTQVAIYNCKVSLAASDTVEVQVRHDANISLGLVGDVRTFFSASRVR